MNTANSSDALIGRLLAPMLLILLIALAVVSLIIALGVQAQDRIGERQQLRVLGAVLETHGEELERLAEDFARRDQAVEKLVLDPDPLWADNTIGAFAHDNLGVFASLVIDAEGAPLFAFAGGQSREIGANPDAFLSGGLGTLVRQARQAPMDQPVPASGYLRQVDGAAQLVAVVAIPPRSPRDSRPAAAARPVLVLTRSLDAALVEQIAERFGIEGLALRDGSAQSQGPMLELRSPGGEVLGKLAFTAPRPGASLLSAIALPLAVAAVLIAVVVWIYLRRLRSAMRSGARKDREHRLILETLPDGVVTLDREGRILAANTKAAQLLGLEAGAASSGSFQQLLIAEHRREFLEALASVAVESEARGNAGSAAALELALQDRDGGVLPIDVTVGACWSDSQPFVAAIIRDARRRQLVETQLRSETARAEAANRAKTRFLQTMSHELRTPLNAIIGFSDVIREELHGPISNPHYRDYAGNISDSGSLLLDMITQLLDLSQIDESRLDIAARALDVGGLIAEAVEAVRPRAESGEISLTWRTGDGSANGLPVLLGDRLRLKQVLLNLLSNAVKFTPAGGQVELVAGRAADRSLVITVADTGVGIAKEEIEAALEPFEHVGRTKRHPSEGAGVGLALSKALCELHDGTLVVESEPGEGTKVTLRLPAERLVETERPIARAV